MKTNNEMAPHIRKTVAEIDEDIAQLTGDMEKLQSMRDGIISLYGGETDIPQVAPSRAPKKARSGFAAKPLNLNSDKPKMGGGNPAPAAGGKPGRQPSAETVKLLASARTAPEPFTAESLHVSTGLETKFCQGRLYAWKADGWITAVEDGYERTKSFPQAAPIE